MDIWYLVTLMGEPEIWMFSTGVLFVLYFFLRKKLSGEYKEKVKKFSFVFIVSVWLTLGVVFGLKSVINIERPCISCDPPAEGCNPYCPNDNAFPSGHAAVIFAVFSSIYVSFRKKWFAPLFIIPFLVSVSRYILGVHHVPDILSGTVVGVFIPIIVFAFYEKILGFIS
jgi:membrane-associated phospholipid phosphatase